MRRTGLTVILALQLCVSFYLLHLVRHSGGALMRTVGARGVPVLFEVGSPDRDLCPLLGRSTVTPDFLEGYLAAVGLKDIQIRVQFSRTNGEWALATPLNGEIITASARSLSTASFQLLRKINESYGIPQVQENLVR